MTAAIAQLDETVEDFIPRHHLVAIKGTPEFERKRRDTPTIACSHRCSAPAITSCCATPRLVNTGNGIEKP